MSKPVHTNDAQEVAPGIFNILPGPDYKATTVYDDGEVRTGYGDSKSEAERNSRDHSTSYYKSG